MDDDTRTFTNSLPHLTNEELEVIVFIKTNQAQDAIGAALGTHKSPETAATHRQNAFDALQVAILAQLVLDVRAAHEEKVLVTPRNDR